MRLILLLALFLISSLLGADEAPPPSKLPPDAVKAVAKADADIVAIRRALIVQLQKSQAEATKKGDLDGALAVKGKIEEIGKEVPAKAAPPPAPLVLQGSYAFDFHTGHRGKLDVRKHEAWENTNHGDVAPTSSGWTIIWANGSHWDINAEGDTLGATASDGHTALIPSAP
jgi:hypothetical protein